MGTNSKLLEQHEGRWDTSRTAEHGPCRSTESTHSARGSSTAGGMESTRTWHSPLPAPALAGQWHD
jgi:hypothetical protein